MTHKWADIKRPGSSCWIKYFLDNSIEIGSDADPLASWTRGRQDKMTGVSLHHQEINLYLITEDGLPGRFWQSDDYEVVIGHEAPVRTTRRIEQKVGSKTWKIVEIDLRNNEIREYTSRHKI